MYCIYIY